VDYAIPANYVIRRQPDQIGGKRFVTVRKYRTSVPFDRASIVSSLAKSRLVFGMDFGVVRRFIGEGENTYLRAICGVVGDRDLVLLNGDTHELDYVRISNVLLATLLIDFIDESGTVGLLVYGGHQGQFELRDMLRKNFGIDSPQQDVFSAAGVRVLCERDFESLYEVVIDPLLQEGWGTISTADFRSERGRYIDSTVDRMQQVRANPKITIRSYKSVLRRQIMVPLEDPYDVKFAILRDGGVSMDIPELSLPKSTRDLEYESIFYDFARQCYERIVGDTNPYEAPSEALIQLSLFSDPA